MGETNSTKTLRDHLKAAGAHVQRFEDKLSPGIPDTNFCWCGREAWLEGKFIPHEKIPKRPTTLIRFGERDEPRLFHQAHWLEARKKAGGIAYWWLRVEGGGWYLFSRPDDPQLLHKGILLPDLRQRIAYGSAKALVEHLLELVAAPPK